MNPEKVVFGFFIVLALTLNFGFFVGEIDDPNHHHVYELFAVVVVNLIATVLKFGDRTQMGAVLLATSLVAVLQLLVAAVIWAVAVHVTETGLTASVMASIVSLTGGAMLANMSTDLVIILGSRISLYYIFGDIFPKDAKMVQVDIDHADDPAWQLAVARGGGVR